MWPELGCACARAAAFLFHWIDRRKYMQACELSGADSSFIFLCRSGSPLFSALYDRAEARVRTLRTARTEDTLHALANGEMRKVKQVFAPDGVTTTDEGPIFDVKAAALELAANDPRYRPAAQPALGVAIQLNISVPRPAACPTHAREGAEDATPAPSDGVPRPVFVR